MNVKELIQSVDLGKVLEYLKETYPTALHPLTFYKENVDIINNTVFSGKEGTITFTEDGDSDVYLIEGDRFDNIVGMEVILPDTSSYTKIKAAGDILWSSGPFGRVTPQQWEWFSNELINPTKANYFAIRAKQIDILLDLPYCRDKKIRQELKNQFNSPTEDLCLSREAVKWLICDKGKRDKIKHNRSKRKRAYRLKKRYEELQRLNNVYEWLDRIESVIKPLPPLLKELILSADSIKKINYQTQTYGKSDRLLYLEDLLTNPIYRETDEPFNQTNSEFLCVLYFSSHFPCSAEEIFRIKNVLQNRFQDKKWHFFMCECCNPDIDIELEIISLIKK